MIASGLQRIRQVKPDIPFDRDDVHRYLPWIMAVMTAISCFIVCVGITISHIVLDDGDDIRHSLQLQIPYADGEEAYQAEKIAKDLREYPGVNSVSVLSASDKVDLLDDWVSSVIDPALLPLPSVMEISLDADSKIDMEDIRGRVKKISPDAVVDNYADWVGNFNQLTGVVQQVIYVLAGATFIAALIIVLLITKTSVVLHFKIVKLLHNIGAVDEYIARQFQINITWLTLKGIIPGATVGLLLYAALAVILRSFEVLALTDISPGSIHIIAVILIPVIMLITVFFVVKWAVEIMLRKLQ